MQIKKLKLDIGYERKEGSIQYCTLFYHGDKFVVYDPNDKLIWQASINKKPAVFKYTKMELLLQMIVDTIKHDLGFKTFVSTSIENYPEIEWLLND